MNLTITVPLSVDMGVYVKDTKKNKIGDKKPPFRLNLNKYKNSHSFMINTAKKRFEELINDMPIEQQFKHKVYMAYTVYAGSNRVWDLSNFASIITKFTEDALVRRGVLVDDNRDILPIILFMYGGYIKGEEKCEVLITDDINDIIQLLLNYDKGVK